MTYIETSSSLNLSNLTSESKNLRSTTVKKFSPSQFTLSSREDNITTHEAKGASAPEAKFFLTHILLCPLKFLASTANTIIAFGRQIIPTIGRGLYNIVTCYMFVDRP